MIDDKSATYYESHFDVYGQPTEPGWGPYLSDVQRRALRAKIFDATAVFTPTERYIIVSGQLGAAMAETYGARGDDVQEVPGMTITATVPAFGLALLGYLMFKRR